MGSPSVIPGSRPRGAVAAFTWNQWQPSSGIGGSCAMESVAMFVWDRRQLWHGIRTPRHTAHNSHSGWLTASISSGAYGSAPSPLEGPQAHTRDYSTAEGPPALPLLQAL